jgi:hypothetical protein
VKTQTTITLDASLKNDAMRYVKDHGPYFLHFSHLVSVALAEYLKANQQAPKDVAG